MNRKAELIAAAFSLAILAPSMAQEPGAADPVAPPAPPEIPVAPPAPAQPNLPDVEPAPRDLPPAPPEAPDAPAAPEAAPSPIITAADGVKEWLPGTTVNDAFRALARQADLGYVANQRLQGPDFIVEGSILEEDPMMQMKVLEDFYNLKIYTKGKTIYVLDQSQANARPATQWTYQLRYLRPADIDAIKNLVQPTLTPGTGIINYEPKTNTLIIIDNDQRIEDARELLEKVDRAKGQIVVETRILRSTANSGMASGVDWSVSLGRDAGVPLSVIDDVNELFNLADSFTGGAIGGTGGGEGEGSESGIGTISETDNGAGLVLSPLQFDAVIRALRDTDTAKQESNPTLITEDNEQALITIIDRFPIITSSNALSAGASQTSEEVRYTIDESDPTIATDPENTREIGVTVSVTPTLLPDNTIRMALRPRSAQIVGFTETAEGSSYPRVSESTIQSIARVPNGHTLMIGGFYSNIETNIDNKIPILGDIPVINFLFKSSRKSNEQTSLVFCVTPKSYDPARAASSDSANRSARQNISVKDKTDFFLDEDKKAERAKREAERAKAQSPSSKSDGYNSSYNNQSRRSISRRR